MAGGNIKVVVRVRPFNGRGTYFRAYSYETFENGKPEANFLKQKLTAEQNVLYR